MCSMLHKVSKVRVVVLIGRQGGLRLTEAGNIFACRVLGLVGWAVGAEHAACVPDGMGHARVLAPAILWQAPCFAELSEQTSWLLTQSAWRAPCHKLWHRLSLCARVTCGVHEGGRAMPCRALAGCPSREVRRLPSGVAECRCHLVVKKGESPLPALLNSTAPAQRSSIVSNCCHDNCCHAIMTPWLCGV